MKIKLVQSGGILPVTKEAETEVDWTKEEAENMCNKIKLSQDKAIPDAISYTLEIDGKETAIDLSKTSGKYAEVLNNLKKNMKIIKT